MDISTESPVVAAARTSAAWCDTVCRLPGGATEFDHDAWVSISRSPPGYPDAVTLRPDVDRDRLLARVDPSRGCSILDSFASLDLSVAGFTVLFHAEWVHRPATAAAPHPGSLTWQPVRSPTHLVAWAAAHGGGAVSGSALLADPSVIVLCATGASGGIAGGAIGTHREMVVNLSNIFTVAADPLEVWKGAVAALAAWRPGLPLVSWQRGAGLSASRRVGFCSVGPLRMWLKPQ